MEKIKELIGQLGFTIVEPLELNTIQSCFGSGKLWDLYITNDYSHVNKVSKYIPTLFLFSVQDEEFDNVELDSIKEVIENQLNRGGEDNVYEGAIPESWLSI